MQDAPHALHDGGEARTGQAPMKKSETSTCAKQKERTKEKAREKGRETKRGCDECFSQLANHGVCSASLGRM